MAVGPFMPSLALTTLFPVEAGMPHTFVVYNICINAHLGSLLRSSRRQEKACRDPCFRSSAQLPHHRVGQSGRHVAICFSNFRGTIILRTASLARYIAHKTQGSHCCVPILLRQPQLRVWEKSTRPEAERCGGGCVLCGAQSRAYGTWCNSFCRHPKFIIPRNIYLKPYRHVLHTPLILDL